MKLRLPHQFQAALMAAIASVSLSTLSTGSTAYCATVNSVNLADWEGYNASTGIATVGNTGTEINHGEFSQPDQQWNSVWNFAIVMDADTLQDGITYDLITTTLYQNNFDGYINGAKMVVNGTKATVTNQGWKNGNTSGPQEFSLEGVDTLTFVMTRTGSSNGNVVLKGYANGDFSNAVVTASVVGVNLSFSAKIRQVNVGALDGLSPHNSVESGVYQVADADVGAYGVMAAGYQLSGALSAEDLSNFYTSTLTMTWNGTDNSDWSSTAQNWLLNNATEASSYDVPRAHAVFGSGADLAKTVEVKGDLIAGSTTIAGDYTFNMTGNLNAGKITIAEGASLAYTGSGALSGALSGAGTYILPNGTAALGSVSLGEGWTGAVRVSGVSFSNTNLATTFTRTGSWVELNGITGGYLNGWNNGKEDANIILTNSANGDVAWKWTDGSSNGETLLTLNGDIKGTGTLFKDTNNKRQGFKFTGDVHGWTGDFRTKVTDVDAVTKLEFAGSAGQGDEPYAVNVANITNEGVAALNVIFSTAGNVSVASNIKKTGTGAVNIAVSSGTSATFTGSIANANTLTLDNNADATFKGTTNITNGVTLGSGASLTNTGDMTLDGTIAFGDNPILNNGSGAITLGNSVKFNLNGMTPDANNKYTLFSGTGQSVDLSGYDETYLILQGGTAGKEWHFGNDGTISFSGVSNKVWSGNDFYWNHTSTTAWKDGTPFKDGDSVRFDDLGDMAYVVIDENVQASTIQVGDGATVIMSTSGGGALSASALVIGNAASVATSAIGGLETYTVGAGASWNIDAGVQTLKAGGVNNGTIVVASSGSVTVEGTTTAASMSGFQNNGTLSIALADATDGDNNIVTMASTSPSTGTLEVRSGTIDYRSKLQSQTLRLGNGARLLFGNANDSHEYSGAIEVAGNASVRTHGTSKHAHVTISGAVTGAQGTLTREDDGNQDLNFTGNVNLGSFVNNDQRPNSLTNFQGPTELGLLIAGNKSKTVFSGGATIGSMTLKGSAAVEIASATSVTSLLDLSNGQESQQRTTGTLSVKDGGVLTIDADASYWGRSASHLLLEDGGMLNIAGMNIVGTAVPDSSTEISTTSDNAKYGIASTDWTISDAAVTATQGLTIGNKLLNSSIATGSNAVTLNNAANVLTTVTVGVGGALTFSAAAELLSAINNSGTVAFNSNVTATGLELHANQAVLLDMNGAYTLDTSGNYFAGATADYIVLVEGGGTVNPGDHTLTMSDTAYDIQSSGLAVANVSWGSGWIKNCQYYQNEGSAKVTEIYANAQALDATCNRIRVTNASLEVDDEAYNLEVDNAHITVTGTNGTIDMLAPLGGTSTIELQTGMTLNLPEISFAENDAETTLRLKHADATDYAVTDNSNLANAMVRITSREDDAERNGRVTITAAAGTSGVYRVNSEGFGVNATKLEKIADSRVQVNNTLNVKEIHNDAAGKTGDFVLTKGVDAAALDTVIATSGNIEFQNMSETEQANLNTLNIGEGMAVSMYTGSVADAAHEASVTVTGTLTAGRGATLNANLEMASGSTLDVSASNGVNGLLMGSSVTLNEGMNLADYTGEWSTWVDGTKYALFTGVDGLDIGSGTGTAAIDYTQWVDASNYFTNITEQNRYFLCYDGAPTANAEAVLTAVGNNGSNVGMVYIMVMPEPTTSTLSLLALAALAARRRKHN